MVLVDTSVWIDCFRNQLSVNAAPLKALIDSDSVCVNDVILAELLPAIAKRGEHELSSLLTLIPRIPLDIRWDGVVQMQTQNLLHGINRVGLPDIIIVQNAAQFELPLFSLDRHFRLMADLFGFEIL